MSFLSEEQTTQLAPDSSSLKAGKDLANDRKWLNYQSNARVLWGEVQGSGKDPYRTQIDLQNIAFKCSCPSRKFPCKHGLGLLFLVAKKNGEIPQVEAEPAWVSEWMNKRTEKIETKAKKEEAEEADPNKAEKQAKDKEKRQHERLLKVEAGVAELDLWLRDMVRTGMLSLPEKGTQYFEKMAARMVDSQATGFASLIKGFTKINYFQGDSWQNEALEIAAKIHLQIEAFKNLEQLPPMLQEEVKSRIGWNIQQKELLENATAEVIDDDWLVIGRKTTQEDDITVQRNWLYGCTSKRYALILNFAYRTAAIETALVPATTSKAKLVFYPSNTPFRAIVKQHLENKSFIPQAIEGIADWEAAQNYYSEILAQNPWADDVPMLLENISFVPNQNQWFLKDSLGNVMLFSPEFDPQKILHLLAISGGQPLNLFVLRQNSHIFPLGIVQNYSYQLV